ncbi:p48 polypeptide of DNA primase [Sporothrix stenoceras]|uniref:DNA primase n=1 Tax=Sporothrix stenoceras TaxID=5173 RepID=A0ABR3ZGG2_9PEZI
MPHAVSDPPSPAQEDAAMADASSPNTVEAESTPTTSNANIETNAETSNEEAVPVKVEQASSPPWVAEDDDDDEMAEEATALAAAPAVTIKTEDGSVKDVLAATAAVKTEEAPASGSIAVKTEETEKAAIITDTVPVNLEDMFDDMDDDDEFSGKPAQETLTTTSDLLSLKASDPEVMRSFYQRLFPWRYLFQWLNHSPTPTNDFAHREFAFTLQNDAYLRYQSFPTSDLLRKDVLRLMPSRFEIGPVYTTNPAERKTLSNASAFKALAKELCFDIDLTDYDDIRTCCDKTTICMRCWQFITMAVRVVDAALRDDFGFQHIIWIYSGRRGAHAWVCDKRARSLDDQKRRAIVGYLEVLRGGSQGGKRVNVRRPLHPHISRSLNVLRTHFQEDVLRDQDPWDTPERAEKLLNLITDRNLADALRRKWDSSPGRSSTAKWADIDAVAKTGSVKGLDLKHLLENKQDIVLEYTYPRLDVNVSKKLNHLLKSPFVVHPGTGRVCVPIDVNRLEEFDPLGVPTVQELLQEIDSYSQNSGANGSDDEPSQNKNGAGGDEKKLQDWEKTSLRRYIEQFRSFVLNLMKDEKDVIRVKRERDEATSMEF